MISVVVCTAARADEPAPALRRHTIYHFADDSIQGDVHQPDVSFVAPPLPRVFGPPPADVASAIAALQASKPATCESRHRLAELLADPLPAYRELFAACPTYERIDLVLTHLARNDTRDAEKYLRALLRTHPSSPHAPEAWLTLGELRRTAGDPRGALEALNHIEPTSELHPLAVYYRGWSHMELGQWDRSLAAFRTAAASEGLHREALADFVRVYAQQGDPAAAPAAIRAIAAPDELVPSLERLGTLYRDAGAHQDVIRIFEELLAMNPTPERAAEYRVEIFIAASHLSPQTAAPKTRPMLEALATAGSPESKTRAEEALRGLATRVHRDARKTRDTSQYPLAADLYAGYVSAFADSKHAKTMRFFFGELLYTQENFLGAADQYEASIALAPESDDDRKLHTDAIDAAVHALHQAVVSAPARDDLSPLEQRLLAASDRYLAQPAGTKPLQSSILLMTARLYHEHGRSDDALSRLRTLVDQHPLSSDACAGANLITAILISRRQLPEAAAALESFLRDDRLNCGEEELIDFTTRLGALHEKLGQASKSAPLFRELVAAARAGERACTIARAALDLAHDRRDVTALRESAIAFGEAKLQCGPGDAKFIAEREIVVELFGVNETVTGTNNRATLERAALAYRALADKLAEKLRRLELDPHSSDYVQLLRFNAAAAYSLAGRNDDATALWRELIETSRGTSGARALEAAILLGEAMLRGGDRARALELFETVLEADADRLEARAALAYLGKKSARVPLSGIVAAAPRAARADAALLPKGIAGEERILAASPVILGSLDAESIRHVIRRNQSQARGCYERALQSNRRLYGRVVVGIEIDGGRVIRARVKESTARSASFEECLVQKILGWQFPAPKGGGIVEVNYPFVFSSF